MVFSPLCLLIHLGLCSPVYYWIMTLISHLSYMLTLTYPSCLDLSYVSSVGLLTGQMGSFIYTLFNVYL